MSNSASPDLVAHVSPACGDQWLGSTCGLPVGHDGMHRATCPCGCAALNAERHKASNAEADLHRDVAGSGADVHRIPPEERSVDRGDTYEL
ncbi:hypothetical protein [Actinopolymorpha alba]|uniref:hypothetical protein n=1 Tax=Actinopolymorpha alba TaxID=533267 RepID=UPI000378BE2E|nr:hypothetical protein [Actinopolymorpha alba]